MASESDAAASDEQPAARVPLALLAALALLWVFLVATAIPGGFTIDEASYLESILQLRQADFGIAGTQGLTRSPEFLFFDPAARIRIDHLDHLGSTAPPLYAVLALPFSVFGFRGLIALNALAFVVSALCVYWLAARRARERWTPWVALVTYVVGAYSIEYAQGLWPHALSTGLAAIGFCLAVRARQGVSTWVAALAGLTLGLATGVRYQNLVFAFAIGVGLLCWAKRRALTCLVYTAAFCVPMIACSLFNHARLGSWNPISKGQGYLSIGSERPIPAMAREGVEVLWAKVVDYSAHPVPDDPIAEATTWWRRDPRTGATIFIGALKKAWLQSSPWLVLSLAAVCAAWFRHRGAGRDVDLRAASLVVAATLGSFAVAGFGRHDGVCFNQRYFLELMPLGAVAAAWFVEGRRLPAGALVTGAALGGMIAAVYLYMGPIDWPEKQLLGLRAPLVIAAALLVSAVLPARAPAASIALAALFAMGVAYSGVIHVGEDVSAARGRRELKRAWVQQLERILPAVPTALLAQKGGADMFAPLLLDHDLVILDTWVDRGASANRLVRELRALKRRVFVLHAGMPQELFDGLVREFGGRPATNDSSLPVIELDSPQGPGAAMTPERS